MRMRTFFAMATIALAAGGLALAHPHFSKTVSAKNQTTEVQLSYFTLPYNEANLAQVTPGYVFVTGGAQLTIAKGTISSNGHEFGPGEYVLRARAKTVDDWELIMVSKADAGEQGQDMSKAVTVASTTHTDTAEGSHLTLDITGGHGETDGKMVIWVWFGPRVVEAAFDMS